LILACSFSCLPAVHPEVTKDGLLNMVYHFTLCLLWDTLGLPLEF
jgi:hypothetical protein